MLFYLILFLVFSTSTLSKQIQNKNQQINSKLNCKNIKCPPVEDPVCVRIKNMNEKKLKVTYIVAINKCEIKYARCRPGIDVVKVPMEKCLHKNSSSKRTKRDTSDEEFPPIAVFVAKNTSGENPLKKEDIEDIVERSDEKKSPNDELDDNENEKNTDSPLIENNISNEGDSNQIGADYDQGAQDVDYIQYEKDCPTVCPARKVMVCAKCQHNIYRTFLSPCHLRLFHCKYPEEKLELISRQPCMQSAPFLTNFPEAKGIVSEPGDQDDVLKFIYCREKGRLGKDPRCKFDEISFK